jgi:hypothetical protein
LVATLVGTISGVAIADLTANDFQPARSGEKTYELTEFEIQYPYREALRDGSTAEDQSRAGVRYDATWATAEYPGPADCQVVLRDADGEEVGEASFEWDSLEATTRLSSFQDIPVTEEPVEASGTCAQGRYEPSRGYSFERVRAHRPDHAGPGPAGTTISGLVRWRGGRPAFTRSCEAHIQLSDGSVQDVAFTLDAPNGREVALLHVPDLAAEDVDDVNVECGPFGQ